jgi:hypothetical protein
MKGSTMSQLVVPDIQKFPTKIWLGITAAIFFPLLASKFISSYSLLENTGQWLQLTLLVILVSLVLSLPTFLVASSVVWRPKGLHSVTAWSVGTAFASATLLSVFLNTHISIWYNLGYILVTGAAVSWVMEKIVQKVRAEDEAWTRTFDLHKF